ncbi:MAG: RNA polymerase sigma factor [Candidatus Limnocylindrales bacterium]|jgi:RNA polymerase sigma-70 factor (ECF subfamily)
MNEADRVQELVGFLKTVEGSMVDSQQQAGEKLVRLVSGGLDRAYRLAGLILGNAYDAEDVTHDAAVRAWRSAGSLRDPAAFEAWFDRIVVNACRDRIRRNRRVRFVALGPDDDPSTGDPFQTLIDHDEALRLIRCLDPDERTVVVLHYWADLPLTEVATRLGWPVGTVKSRLHRALETMRDERVVQGSGKAASR